METPFRGCQTPPCWRRSRTGRRARRRGARPCMDFDVSRGPIRDPWWWLGSGTCKRATSADGDDHARPEGGYRQADREANARVAPVEALGSAQATVVRLSNRRCHPLRGWCRWNRGDNEASTRPWACSRTHEPRRLLRLGTREHGPKRYARWRRERLCTARCWYGHQRCRNYESTTLHEQASGSRRDSHSSSFDPAAPPRPSRSYARHSPRTIVRAGSSVAVRAPDCSPVPARGPIGKLASLTQLPRSGPMSLHRRR
jgi:hypothetical protein